MNAQTRVSAKGQVVIPKDVRDRFGLSEGVELAVIETAAGILLSRSSHVEKVDAGEALSRVRKAISDSGIDLGRPLGDDAIGEAVRAKWGDHRRSAV